MRLLGDSGIFELFIPGLKPGQIYKYEIKTKAGLPMLKADRTPITRSCAPTRPP